MNNDQQRQREFVEQLLAIQQKRQNKPLSKIEQQEIAAQIGLSDSDWQAVQETYKAHLLRGRGFLSHQNYDDAISELEKANVLDYNSIETTAILAQAHYERFKEFSDEKDKQAAISYSEICLNQNPSHTQSLTLISELKRKEKKQEIVISRTQKSTNKLIYIGIPVFLAFIIGFFYFSSSQTSIENTIPQENTIIEPVKKVENTVIQNSNGVDFNASEYEVPIEIKDEKLKNLEWKTESSLVTKYTDSYKVEVIGDFLLKNAQLDELKVKLEFFDDKGELILTDYKEVVSKSAFTLRKDDLIPFQIMKYEKTAAPNIAKIIMSSSFINEEKFETPLKYEVSPKIPVSWGQKQPQNTAIELRERQSSFSNNMIGGGFHTVTLEVENTGNTAISVLKFNFSWFDASKKLLGTDFRYAVSGSTSKLKRNQTRIFSTVMAVPKVKKEELSKLTYIVEVIEIK